MFLKKSEFNTTLAVMLIVVILAFVIITVGYSRPIKSLIGTFNDNTRLPGDMSEENMYEMIKKYCEMEKYQDALDLSNEFILVYPKSKEVHGVYYMKLYALINTLQYDGAGKLVKDYIKKHPEKFKNPLKHKASQKFFDVFDIIGDSGNDDELDGFEELFNIASGPGLDGSQDSKAVSNDDSDGDNEILSPIDFINNVLVYNQNCFGVLRWPGLGEDITEYPVEINPYFMNWYWYAAAQTNEGCSPDSYSFFTGLIASFVFNMDSENQEKIVGTGAKIKVMCEQGFRFGLITSLDAYLNGHELCAIDSIKVNRINSHDISIYDYLGFHTSLDKFDLLDKYVKIAYLYLIIEDVKCIGNLDSLSETIDGFPVDETFKFMEYYYKGLVNLELAFWNLEDNDCILKHNKLLAELFHNDGNLNEFKTYLDNSESDLSKCIQRSDAKENFKNAYLHFKQAYVLVDGKVNKVNLHKHTLVAEDEGLNADEIKKYKSYVLPFLIQASIVNDALNNGFDFQQTREIFRMVELDFSEIIYADLVVQNKLYETENVCGNGIVDIDEDCDIFSKTICNGRCVYPECKCEGYIFRVNRLDQEEQSEGDLCGNGKIDKGEECDISDDGQCPGKCIFNKCKCSTVSDDVTKVTIAYYVLEDFKSDLSYPILENFEMHGFKRLVDHVISDKDNNDLNDYFWDKTDFQMRSSNFLSFPKEWKFSDNVIIDDDEKNNGIPMFSYMLEMESRIEGVS